MYKRPLILLNDDLAEGVYADGSGNTATSSTDCWDVGGKSVQDWNGSHNVFEMWSNHHTDVEHITTEVTYTYTFSSPITDAYAEAGFKTTVSGNTVTVVRDLHANGYKSGDRVTFKVWVKCADEATTKAVDMTNVSYVCRHEVNVQGKID